MKLNLKALALTIAIIWGAGLFCVGLANLIWPTYGTTFLQCVASIYPGYHATPSFGQVIVGTIYALVDGFIAGIIAGWLYNRFAVRVTAAV